MAARVSSELRLLSTAVLVLCALPTMVSSACPATTISVAGAFQFTSCIQASVFTVQGATSVTLTSSSIAGLVFNYVSAVSITGFSLTIDGTSSIVGSTAHLIEFTQPLYKSSITFISGAKLLQSGAAFHILSVAGISQEVTVAAGSATLSTASSAFVNWANGLIGSVNVLSLNGVTLTGAGPVFTAASRFEAALTITGAATAISLSSALISTSASVSGFTFTGHIVTASTMTCGGGLFMFSGRVSQSGVSFVGKETWDFQSSSLVSVGGSATGLAISATELTVVGSASLIVLTGAVAQSSIFLSAVSLTSTQTFLTMGAPGATPHGISITTAAPSSTIRSGTACVSASGALSSFTLVAESTTFTGTGSWLHADATLGQTEISVSSSTIAVPTALIRAVQGGSLGITVMFTSVTATASANGFFASQPWSSQASNFFSFLSGTKISTTNNIFSIVGLQPQLDVTVSGSSTVGCAKVVSVDGVTLLNYYSTTSTLTCSSACFDVSSGPSGRVFLSVTSTLALSTSISSGGAILTTGGVSTGITVLCSGTTMAGSSLVVASTSTIGGLLLSMASSAAVSGTSNSQSVISLISSPAVALSLSGGSIVTGIGGFVKVSSATTLAVFVVSSSVVAVATSGILVSGALQSASVFSMFSSQFTVTAGTGLEVQSTVNSLILSVHGSSWTASSSLLSVTGTSSFSSFALIGAALSSGGDMFVLTSAVSLLSHYDFAGTTTTCGGSVFKLGAGGDVLAFSFEGSTVVSAAGALVSIAGTVSSSLVVSFEAVALGSVATPLQGGIVTAATVQQLSLFCRSSTVTSQGAAAQVSVASVVGTTTLSISSSTLNVASGTLVQLGTLSATTGNVFSVASSTVSTTDVLLSTTGTIASLSASVTSSTITAATLLSCGAGANRLSLSVALSPVVATSSIVVIAGASSAVGLTFTGASAATKTTLEGLRLVSIVSPTSMDTMQQVTIVASFVSLSILSSGCVLGHASGTIASSSFSLTSSTVSSINGGSVISLGSAVSTMSIVFSTVSMTSGGATFTVGAAASLTSVGVLMTSCTVDKAPQVVSVASGGTHDTFSISIVLSTLLLTAFGVSSAAVEFGGGSLGSPSVSLSSSVISITGSAPNQVLSMFLMNSGTSSAVTFRSISNTFATSSTSDFTALSVHIDGGHNNAPVGVSTNVFEISTTTFSTTTNSRQQVLLASGASLGRSAITINCLVWDMTNSPVLQFVGTATSVTGVFHSVALWKTRSASVVSFENAGSSGNAVELYDSKLFGASVIAPPAAVGVVSNVKVGCSWHGNFPMRPGSFTALVAAVATEVACVQLHNPSCWSTLTRSKSLTLSKSPNVTDSFPSLTPSETYSYSTTPTWSSTSSGSFSSESSSSASESESSSQTCSSTEIQSDSASETFSPSSTFTSSSSASYSDEFTSSKSGSPSTSTSESTSHTPTNSQSESSSQSSTVSSSFSRSEPSETSDATLTASKFTESDAKSASRSVTLTSSPTESSSISPSEATPTTEATSSRSVSASITLSPSTSLSVSESPVVSGTSSSSASLSLSESASVTPSPTSDISETLGSPTDTISNSPSLTPSPSPSSEQTASVPSISPSPSPTESVSPSPTSSPSIERPSVSVSATPSPTRTTSPSSTLSPSDTAASPTPESSLSPSATPSPTPSASPSQSPSVSRTFGSATPTLSNSSSVTLSESFSDSYASLSSRLSETVVPTKLTHELTPSHTVTRTKASPTASISEIRSSASPTATVSASPSGTPQPSTTETASRWSVIPTPSLSWSSDVSPSRSVGTFSTSPTNSWSPSKTFTITTTRETATRDATVETTLSKTFSLTQQAHSQSVSLSNDVSVSVRSITATVSQVLSSLTTTRTVASKSRMLSKTRSLLFTTTVTNSTTLSTTYGVFTETILRTSTHRSPSKTSSQSPTKTISGLTQTATRLLTFDVSVSRTVTNAMSLSESLTQSLPRMPTHTVNRFSLTLTETHTKVKTPTTTNGTLSRSRSVASDTISKSSEQTITNTSIITYTLTEDATSSASAAVTQQTHKSSTTVTLTYTPSFEEGRRIVDPNGVVVILQSVTETATVSVSTSEDGVSSTQTVSLTESPPGVVIGNAAALRISDYRLIVTSDCFKGTMGILLPMLGVVVGVTLLQYFVIVRDDVVFDEGLRVSRIRNFAANHLYLGFLFPCHNRCVILHGVEVAVHVTLIICLFSLMYFVFDPPNSNMRIVVAAAAVVVSCSSRSFTSRIGWWYRGRPELHLPYKPPKVDPYGDDVVVAVDDTHSIHSADDEISDDGSERRQRNNPNGYPGLPPSVALPHAATRDYVEATTAPQPANIRTGGILNASSPRHQGTLDAQRQARKYLSADVDVDDAGGKGAAYFDDIDIYSLYDPERVSRHHDLASLRDDDVLDLMSLPASLFAPGNLKQQTATRSNGSGSERSSKNAKISTSHLNSTADFSFGGDSPTKAYERRHSTWFAQPLSAVEEEEAVWQDDSSSVDLNEILAVADFHPPGQPSQKSSDSRTISDKKHRGRDDVYAMDDMSISVGSILMGDDDALYIDYNNNDSSDAAGKQDSQNSRVVNRNNRSSYTVAYVVNIVAFVVAFVGAFLLVSSMSRSLQCENFSTSVALGVFGFDIFVAQTAYAVLVGYSLWRNRILKIDEHVWVLHPR